MPPEFQTTLLLPVTRSLNPVLSALSAEISNAPSRGVTVSDVAALILALPTPIRLLQPFSINVQEALLVADRFQRGKMPIRSLATLLPMSATTLPRTIPATAMKSPMLFRTEFRLLVVRTCLVGTWLRIVLFNTVMRSTPQNSVEGVQVHKNTCEYYLNLLEGRGIN